MKKVFLQSFPFFIILLLFSCSHDPVQKTNTINPDVYVSGVKANHACYWKNNQLFTLNDLSATESEADTIIVSGTDVHILGAKNTSSNPISLYWKNGSVTNLNSAFSTSTEPCIGVGKMDIYNNDVYFLGMTQNTTVTPNTYNLAYWKNGVKTIIATYPNEYIIYTGMKIINNNVYVNIYAEINGTLLNGYYVNQTFVPITNVILWDCDSDGTDPYIYGGTYPNYNGYYKNLNTNIETLISNSSAILKMCFDNGNIYCTNGETLFKNGNIYLSYTGINTYNDYYTIHSFQIVDDSLFLMTDETINTNSSSLKLQRLLIENVLYQQNGTDEVFNSLFIAH